MQPSDIPARDPTAGAERVVREHQAVAAGNAAGLDDVPSSGRADGQAYKGEIRNELWACLWGNPEICQFI
jgi:hypothetical protein